MKKLILMIRNKFKGIKNFNVIFFKNTINYDKIQKYLNCFFENIRKSKIIVTQDHT